MPIQGTASLLLGIVIETVCGSLVGILLVALSAMSLVALSGQSDLQSWHYGFGALLGGLFGALVAITRRRTTEAVSEQL